MVITINDKKPIETFQYLEVGSGQLNKNGKSLILHKSLPIYLGEYKNDKTEIDYLIICSDLQGIVEDLDKKKLLGEALPSFLKLLLDVELNHKKDSKIGVLLCGDFYANLEKRGSSGDVRSVWNSFNKEFDWVVGVAGNHDSFGDKTDLEIFKKQENIHLLHKEIRKISGLNIGGISGIIGRVGKLNRVEESDYLNNLKKLLNEDLDFLLLHETPTCPSFNFYGNPKIRLVIESNPPSKILCGHCHWEKTLVEFPNQSLVMNVDSKVVILKIKKEKSIE